MIAFAGRLTLVIVSRFRLDMDRCFCSGQEAHKQGSNHAWPPSRMEHAQSGEQAHRSLMPEVLPQHSLLLSGAFPAHRGPCGFETSVCSYSLHTGLTNNMGPMVSQHSSAASDISSAAGLNSGAAAAERAQMYLHST